MEVRNGRKSSPPTTPNVFPIFWIAFLAVLGGVGLSWLSLKVW